MGFWDEAKNKGGLSGSNGNRVKAIKLRQVVSQGVMYPVDAYEHGLTINVSDGNRCTVRAGDDVSLSLDIIKYEPPVPVNMQGQVGSMFGYTHSYDIENIQNTENLFEDGEEVVVTEKLHGTLSQNVFISTDVLPLPEEKLKDLIHVYGPVYAFATSKGLAKQGLIQKNSETNQDNLYLKNLKEILTEPRGERLAKELITNNLKQMFIFGEIFGPGVQSGYGYGRTKPDFRVFDVFFQGESGINYALHDSQLNGFVFLMYLNRVPELYRGPFSMAKMIELRDGSTVEGKNQHIREGIVIRPTTEKLAIGLPGNRKQVKMVSPAYLLKTTGEEFN